MKILFSLVILLCGLASSAVSLHLVLGISRVTVSVHHLSHLLPFIFSIVTLVGYLREKTSVIDAGIMMSMVTYSFINRNLSLSVLNTLSIVGLLFLFVGIWFFARYLLLLESIEESARKGSQGEEVFSFSRSARTYVAYGIFTNVLLGAFLSIMASLMGSYSSLGRITSGRIETVLMIVFTFSLFLVIYKMIDLLAPEEE